MASARRSSRSLKDPICVWKRIYFAWLEGLGTRWSNKQYRQCRLCSGRAWWKAQLSISDSSISKGGASSLPSFPLVVAVIAFCIACGVAGACDCGRLCNVMCHGPLSRGICARGGGRCQTRFVRLYSMHARVLDDADGIARDVWRHMATPI